VEGITLERPPGANGAAWGDIDVRAHQRAHRYLPTRLHDDFKLRRCSHGCAREGYNARVLTTGDRGSAAMARKPTAAGSS
jgi:hypothetical protein